MSKQKKRILLLGGSGLLGYHCLEVMSADAFVFPTYNSMLLNVENSIHFDALGGQNELSKIIYEVRPHAIINTIAMVTVDGCESHQTEAYRLNVGLVEAVVNALVDCHLLSTHLVQISSDSVYGLPLGTPYAPWHENDQCKPLSVYAQTKLKSEFAAQRYSGPLTIIRTAFYGLNPGVKKGLLWWILNNVKNETKMHGWDNVYFSPVSASLLAETIGQILANSITGTINIASNDSCSKFNFIEEVCRNFSDPSKVIRTKSANDGGAIRPYYTVLSTKKLRQFFPWDVRWKEDLMAYMGKIMGVGL